MSCAAIQHTIIQYTVKMTLMSTVFALGGQLWDTRQALAFHLGHVGTRFRVTPVSCASLMIKLKTHRLSL